MQIHVVQPGETVFSIARLYGVSPTRLAADNEVGAGGALAVGQTLVVLFPRTEHTVAAGETLSSIARLYGVSTRQLWRNNWPLQGRSTLYPGQRLVISYEGEKLGALRVNSYAYPFISATLLDAELPYLSYLTPFTYGITAAGGLLPLEDEAMLAAARRYGVAPMLHLSTLTEDGGFSSQRAVQVLTNSAVQSRLIDEVETMVREKGFAGVDVDFEYIPAAQGAAYADFLRRLRRRLTPLPLWAALAPKTSPDQPGLLYEAHDYAAIGAAVDAVLLMTYEWGYTSSPPPSQRDKPYFPETAQKSRRQQPPALSLSKKPRRVRTRRCEKNEICFFRRHVCRKKHFSARKCASCPLKADGECAQRAVALLEKVARPLFRQSQPEGVPSGFSLFYSSFTVSST